MHTCSPENQKRPTGNQPAPPTEMLRGLSVTTLGRAAVLGQLVRWIEGRRACGYFACVNAHSAEMAHRDPSFMAALEGALIRVPDGASVTLVSKLCGGGIRERVTGPDIFFGLSQELGREGGRSVYYLGGHDDLLRSLVRRHEELYPNLRIAGVHAPPFQQEFTRPQVAEMCARINAARPDVVWVGLGAPKQEKWARQAVEMLDVPLVGPIGAVFGFLGGAERMPPEWVLAAGFGWLYRLGQNPRRMWKRNMDTPLFLWRAVRDRLAGSALERHDSVSP